MWVDVFFHTHVTYFAPVWLHFVFLFFSLRAELAEKNLKAIEEDLEKVGNDMKQLESSAEKALEREEKLVEKIYNLQNKYKVIIVIIVRGKQCETSQINIINIIIIIINIIINIIITV